jgi:hypothetical protein
MDLKEAANMSKSSEKFTLREPITIEALYQLMTERWSAELPGTFKLKKGLFGKSIQFSVYMQILPVVTVKGNVVTVRRTTQSTTVGGTDFKDVSQRMAAAKEGGLKKAALGGGEYLVGVRNGMRALLQDKLI